MDDFITKPVSMRELDRVIETWGEGKPKGRKTAGDPTPPTGARAVALQRVGGVEATLTVIAQKFGEEAPRLLGEISKAIDNDAASDCERSAHTLKGSADIFGLEELVALALAVERQGNSDDLDGARRALPELRAAVDRALTRLASW